MNTDTTIDDTGGHGEADSAVHARPRYDDINTPVVVLIGVISAVVTLVVIWAVEGLYYHWHANLIRERNYDVVNWRQVDEINAQKEKLNGVPEEGFASLESVIPLVLEKYQSDAPDPESAAGSEPEPAHHLP